ncbi:MAG: hypothetical protein ACI33K_01945 [Clostridiaceae bacterium]
MIGKTVWHKAFGRGEICEMDSSYIQISFEKEEVDNKKFAYPEAFRSFLKFEDSELQKQVESDLGETDRIEREEKLLEKQESEKIQVEEAELKAKALKEKRAAAAKKRKDAKKKEI